MSNKHHRLCAENRKVIANMKQAGKTQDEIAQAIGFSQSATSKELSRNQGERGSAGIRLNKTSVSKVPAKYAESRHYFESLKALD